MTIPLVFKTKKVDLTTTLRELVTSKLQRIERLVPEEETDLLLEIELEETNDAEPSGYTGRVELMLKVAGKIYRADNVEETVEAALDQAVDELATQVRRDHDRMVSERRREGAAFKEELRNQ